MAYTAVAPRDLAFPGTKAARPAPRRGFFARMGDAIMAARMRQVEREIARYLADTGGKFTDEAEREIERRFLAHSPR